MDSRGEYTLVNLGESPELIYDLDYPVDYLAARYYRFVFPDASARSVALYNPFNSVSNPNVEVQTMYKIEGQPVWQNGGRILVQNNYCRDLKAERLEELIVIVSNSDWRGKTPTPSNQGLKLMVNNIGCWKWIGEASIESHSVWPDIFQFQGSAGVHRITLQALFPPSSNTVTHPFDLVGRPGFEWGGSGVVLAADPPCTCTFGPGSFQSESSTAGTMLINNFLIREVSYPVNMLDTQLGTKPRACIGSGAGAADSEIEGVGCDGGCGPWPVDWAFLLGNSSGGTVRSIVVPNNGTIEDDEDVDLVVGAATHRIHYHARFTPLRE